MANNIFFVLLIFPHDLIFYGGEASSTARVKMFPPKIIFMRNHGNRMMRKSKLQAALIAQIPRATRSRKAKLDFHFQVFSRSPIEIRARDAVVIYSPMPRRGGGGGREKASRLGNMMPTVRSRFMTAHFCEKLFRSNSARLKARHGPRRSDLCRGIQLILMPHFYSPSKIACNLNI